MIIELAFVPATCLHAATGMVLMRPPSGEATVHSKTTMAAPQDVSKVAASTYYIRTGEIILLKEEQRKTLKRFS